MIDLSALTEQQLRAVTSPEGPLSVIAAPGSGKTAVLACRIAFLIDDLRIAPESVLAVAFSKRAAGELRERLYGVLGERAVGVEVHTYHSLGYRLISQNRRALGLGLGKLAVVSAGNSRKLALEAASRAGLDASEPHTVVEQLSSARNMEAGERDEQQSALMVEYEELLGRRNSVDYHSMVSLPVRLFGEYPDLARRYGLAWRAILADESQDTDRIQYQLLAQLASVSRNLTVVGDPAQALYRWRGADGDRLFRKFGEDFPDAVSVALQRNFRSPLSVVQLANRLSHPILPGRRMWTERQGEEPVMLYEAHDPSDEAGFVASTVASLLEGGVCSPRDVAVLYRHKGLSQPVADALKAAGIPYLLRGGSDLLGHREVKDVLAYLRLLSDPEDSTALARIVDTPPRGLEDVQRALKSHTLPLAELSRRAALFGEDVERRARMFAAVIERLHGRTCELPPERLIDLVMTELDYRSVLWRSRDCNEKLGRVGKLRRLASQSGAPLDEWLVSLDTDPTETELVCEDAVSLSSVHSYKGLEADVVFLIGLEDGVLPSSQSLRRLPADWSDLHDERKVAYVGVTRARRQLFLTYCRYRAKGDSLRRQHISRFLADELLGLKRAA